MAGGLAVRERRSPRPGWHPERRRHVTADCATLEDQCHPRKIFVGGLAHKTTTQQLRDYFSRYGAVIDAVVLRWPDGRSRGFGYVTFSETAAASDVLRVSHQVGGRQVDVKRAVPGTNKLFVGGLPQNTAAAELREHFEAFGVVSDAVVMIDPATSRSRGFGFVCFLPGQEGAAAVAAALDQYQNHRIRGKWIEVKSAAPPHKLAAKDGMTWADGVARMAWEVSSAAAAVEWPEVAPCPSQFAGRPVASPQRSQEAIRAPGPGTVTVESEPRKVALPVTTAATMSSAISAMGTPRGLVTTLHSQEAQQLYPWSGWALPAQQAAPTPLLGEAGLVGTWGDGFGAGRGSIFTTSDSLQKSLEQLLRQQSLQIEAGKADVQGKEIEPAEAVAPSTTGMHGG